MSFASKSRRLRTGSAIAEENGLRGNELQAAWRFPATAGKPRMIHVLHRGNIQQPGEPPNDTRRRAAS